MCTFVDCHFDVVAGALYDICNQEALCIAEQDILDKIYSLTKFVRGTVTSCIGSVDVVTAGDSLHLNMYSLDSWLNKGCAESNLKWREGQQAQLTVKMRY